MTTTRKASDKTVKDYNQVANQLQSFLNAKLEMIATLTGNELQDSITLLEKEFNVSSLLRRHRLLLNKIQAI